MSLLEDNFSESFLKGFSSALDIYPRIELPERLQSETQNSSLLVDVHALTSDFKKFEYDMNKAIQIYESSDK